MYTKGREREDIRINKTHILSVIMYTSTYFQAARGRKKPHTYSYNFVVVCHLENNQHFMDNTVRKPFGHLNF